MIVYRLSKSKYKDDLSGKGAEIAGGRWNSKGVAVLYACESRSLCVTEIAVHTPIGIIPKDFSLITLEIPDHLIDTVAVSQLPNDWKSYPYSKNTQKLGNLFVKNFHNVALKVPSAVVNGEFNFVFNVKHPLFNQVTIVNQEPFEFDNRMFV
jgi:RES domain-containing protein